MSPALEEDFFAFPGSINLLYLILFLTNCITFLSWKLLLSKIPGILKLISVSFYWTVISKISRNMNSFLQHSVPTPWKKDWHRTGSHDHLFIVWSNSSVLRAELRKKNSLRSTSQKQAKEKTSRTWRLTCWSFVQLVWRFYFLNYFTNFHLYSSAFKHKGKT